MSHGSRDRRGVRSTVFGLVWGLALAGGILAHRAGLLPAWVYHGRVRDEVKRRTGVDLADRTISRPAVQVTDLHGQGGRYPTLTLTVRNVTDTSLRYLEMWARFHLVAKDAGSTPTTTVAGGDRGPLRPGESRTVTLRVGQMQGLGVTTRGPLLTADLYWAFHAVPSHRRARRVPDMTFIPVR